MSNKIIKPLPFDTYLAMVENAVGSKMFQTGYVEIDGIKTDVTQAGDLSCALFVSSVLKIFDLIDGVHATVKSTVAKMEEAGWEKTTDLKPGCVLVWEEKLDDKGESHGHVGFYIGGDQAISNNSEQKVPTKHHFTYGSNGAESIRKIIAIYWQPKFFQSKTSV